MNWVNADNIVSKKYKCGYCGSPLASQKGYTAQDKINGSTRRVAWIYICHNCEKPTFFDKQKNQTPGPIIGSHVKHIPNEDVENLFDEAKACFSINAYTSAVMCCRKLLMNISVSEGAKEGATFAQYVTYLEENYYIPPNGKKWVDSIRKLGNEANHKINFKTSKEAERILNFTEMLLRFIYELPGIMEETEVVNCNSE